ncbi:MAG: hypothetical protein H0U72_06525 [Nitrosospira sp.]|nr:hypothetical protein [Nitrosospira sp.]
MKNTPPSHLSSYTSFEHSSSEQNLGLGVFIRALVGLDIETANQAFSGFISGTTATPDQIEFIALVVQYLTENGVMEPERLYESPFTDISPHGPDALFSSDNVAKIIDVLTQIKHAALCEPTWSETG